MDNPADLNHKLCIGASGYSYDDWVGSFYPRGTPKSDFIKFYASKFSVVEVNATYYRIPPPRSFAAMANKTPSHFQFVVKANQDMTHSQSRKNLSMQVSWRRWSLSERRGSLRGSCCNSRFLFVTRSERGRILLFLRQELPSMRLWAEFRHQSWATPPVLEYLRRLSVGYCAVDEPNASGTHAAHGSGHHGHRVYPFSWTQCRNLVGWGTPALRLGIHPG